MGGEHARINPRIRCAVQALMLFVASYKICSCAARLFPSDAPQGPAHGAFERLAQSLLKSCHEQFGELIALLFS